MKKLLPTLAFSILASFSSYSSAEINSATTTSYYSNEGVNNSIKDKESYLNKAITDNRSFISNMKSSMLEHEISKLCHRKETLIHQASIADTIVANRANGEEIDITPDMLAPQHLIDQMLSYDDNTLIDFSNKSKIEALDTINSITYTQLSINKSPMENPC